MVNPALPAVCAVLCTIVPVFCKNVLKSLAEKKKRLQEDVARLEAEMEELRAGHEVSLLLGQKQ